MGRVTSSKFSYVLQFNERKVRDQLAFILNNAHRTSQRSVDRGPCKVQDARWRKKRTDLEAGLASRSGAADALLLRELENGSCGNGAVRLLCRGGVSVAQKKI